MFIKGSLIWFTGLPSSGKTTIANALNEKLKKRYIHTVLLDGDAVRKGLCSDLKFSKLDRIENIRRIGEVSKLFLDAGVNVITSFISPYRESREWVRNLVGIESFIEVFCDCPIEVCRERDLKGNYKKALQGLIPEFTGVSSLYEAPLNAEVVLKTEFMCPEICANTIIEKLYRKGSIE